MFIIKGENMEKTLKVSGMHCRSCELLLTDVLSEITGISKVSIDQKAGTVKFSYDSEGSLLQAKKAIEAEGYNVS